MRTIYTIALVASLAACGTLKDIGRTINDAGRILCELWAAENTDTLGGMTPANWCAIVDNVQPFIDEALAAKQAVGQRIANPEASTGGETPAAEPTSAPEPAPEPAPAVAPPEAPGPQNGAQGADEGGGGSN